MRSSSDEDLSRLKKFASLSKTAVAEVTTEFFVCTLTGAFMLSSSGFECRGQEGSLAFDSDVIESVQFDEALAGEPTSNESALDRETGVAFATIHLQGNAPIALKRVPTSHSAF